MLAKLWGECGTLLVDLPALATLQVKESKATNQGIFYSVMILQKLLISICMGLHDLNGSLAGQHESVLFSQY
jgi:hypothetical protein